MSRRANIEAIRAVKSGWDPTGLQLEIAGEAASTLGVQGKKAADALRLLKAQGTSADEEQLDRTAYAVWAFFIQRELCGMRNHKDIIAELDIPTRVLQRMGSAAMIKAGR